MPTISHTILTFDVVEHVVELNDGERSRIAPFAYDNVKQASGPSPDEMVSFMASALGRDPNEWGGTNEWWALDVSLPEEIRISLEGTTYDDRLWATRFSLKYVGELNIFDGNEHIEVIYDEEHSEDATGYRYFEEHGGSESRNLESVWLGGSISDTIFRPEWELGLTVLRAEREGFSPNPVWYARALTGPAPGTFNLEFRCLAPWRRPRLKEPMWS
ncbi:hypothetical protein [Actinomyces capricornis]|uniref:Uncharacterized protein n=1 Tax=Actinomyces capricornis TaxID=2755559 RepID=A0ABN6K848_9ACTO|nr:hypothetical protein [Actinomyces capricornis]BDA65663.1 hypothetical protein MANAM107_24970 [Actinomyces capricornis]